MRYGLFLLIWISVAFLPFLACIENGMAASAIAFNRKNGSYGIASNRDSTQQAEVAAFESCVDCEIIYSGPDLGFWAISLSKPLFIGDPDPYIIGFAAGGSHEQGTMNEAYLQCQKRSGTHCNLGEFWWKEHVGEKSASPQSAPSPAPLHKTSTPGLFFSSSFDYYYVCIGQALPSGWHAIGKASSPTSALGPEIEGKCPNGVYWVKRDK